MSNFIGQTLINQYRVNAFVASGGMGAVYRVWDLKRNVPLAMKVLHSELADDPHVFERFKREANALKKLTHPNIVQFYGLYQTMDLVFLLERYVDGPSMKDILRQRAGKPLSVPEALIYLKALSSALGYAHANGVVHCDVKPGNVLIDQGGNVYLTDFGIARHAESTATTMGAAGTAAYMAPEQIRGKSVTPATDVYALGVMLFEMLTGQRPFRGNEAGTEKGGDTANERIRYAHLYMHLPNPRGINSGISESLAQTVLKALDKNPANRYHSMQEFLTAVYTVSNASGDLTNDRVAIPAEFRKIETLPDHPVPLGRVERGKKTSISSRKLIPYWLGAVILVLIILLPAIFRGGTTTSAPEIASFVSTTDQSQSVPLPMQTDNPLPLPSETDTAVPPMTETNTLAPSPTLVSFTKNPKDGVDLVPIPAGEFIMGSDSGDDPYFLGAEGPSHKVYVDAYTIYRTEVTNGMYQKCVVEKACPRPDQNWSRTNSDYYGNPKFDNYPVIHVSWVSAQSYCKWAGGRLPTEAEWEKAARGEDGRLFPWGNAPPQDRQINMCDSYCADSGNRTAYIDGYPDIAPVGVHPESESQYGVLDMSGNVWEWVFDWMTAGYPKKYEYENPKGPASGSARVLRGGSWRNITSEVRTVFRISLKPERSLDTVGFRCVIELSAATTRVPTATISVQPGKTETSSSSSQLAQISNEVGEVNLRRSPGYLDKNDNADVVIKIPKSARVEIIGGPANKDGLTWWNISWNGYEGWVADHTGSGRTILIFDQ